jgi:ABC-type sugar transport system ATPase subunit
MDAFRAGIATVYQEMSLVKGLTVAENILLGRWPRQRWLGIDTINRRQTRQLALEALELMGVDLDLGETVSRLSVAAQQVVEIAKVVSLRPKVMILDEPTSALPQAEVDHLLALVRRLAENGVAVIYVSHRLQEIPRVADSITFLRDGRLVDTIPIAEATPERVANMIVGDQWTRALPQQAVVETGREVRLSVQHVSRQRYLHDVSFDLHAGEVLGLAGLLGSGRTELVRAIFGLDAIDSGTIAIDGQVITRPSPTQMKAKGVGLTPEDRKAQGLVLALDVEDNLTLSALDRVSHNQVISTQAKRGLAQKMVDALSIQTPNLAVKALSLSGGNQQKLVVGKWLNSQARILLMDEPTRGIDIQAKEQIYGLVRNLARQGISIIFISSEIEDVLEVADRILVLNQGRIVADIPAAQADIEQILALAMSEEVVL